MASSSGTFDNLIAEYDRLTGNGSTPSSGEAVSLSEDTIALLDVLGNILLHVSDSNTQNIDITKTVKLLDIFKSQKFGRSFYKLKSEQDLISTIHVTIIIASLNLRDNANHRGISLKPLLHKISNNLDETPACGPIFLLGSVLELIVDVESEIAIADSAKAMELGAFSYIHGMLVTADSCSHSVKRCVYRTVYDLLSIVVNVFHAGHLVVSCDTIHDTVAKLLSDDSLSYDFWNVGLGEGLGSILGELLCRMPLTISYCLPILSSLVVHSPKPVISLLQSLSNYSELLSDDLLSGIRWESETNCVLSRRRTVVEGVLALEPGTTGVVGQTGGCVGHLDDVTKQPLDLSVITWEAEYNGWSLILVKLRSASRVRGQIDPALLECIRLISSLIASQPHLVASFASLYSSTLHLFHNRLSLLPTFTTNSYLSIKYTLEFLDSLASLQPDSVVSNLVGCNFIARRIADSVYGKLLREFEIPGAEFGVTVCVASIVAKVVQASKDESSRPSCLSDKPSYVSDKPSYVSDKPSYMSDKPSYVSDKPSYVSDKPSYMSDKPSYVSDKPSDEFSSLFNFLVTDVFHAYLDWKFQSNLDKLRLGLSLLSLYHETVDQPVGPLSLVCLSNVLTTSIGSHLIDLVVYAAQLLLQPSHIGEFLSNLLVKRTLVLAMSALNRSVLLRSELVAKEERPSVAKETHPPLVTDLETSFRSGKPIVSLFNLVTGSTDYQIATLAAILLKRIAAVAPSTFYYFIYRDVQPITKFFASQFQSDVVPLNFRIELLQLFVAIVQMQPALAASLLRQPAAPTSSLRMPEPDPGGRKRRSQRALPDIPEESPSCLEAIVGAVEGPGFAEPGLQGALLAALSAVWRERKELAMGELRFRPELWSRVREAVASLGDPSSGTRCATVALGLLACEIHNAQTLGHLSGLDLSSRLVSWARHVSEAIAASLEGVEALVDAWRAFLLAVAKRPDELGGLYPSIKYSLISVMVNTLLSMLDTGLDTRLVATVSSLLLSLTSHWAVEAAYTVAPLFISLLSLRCDGCVLPEFYAAGYAVFAQRDAVLRCISENPEDYSRLVIAGVSIARVVNGLLNKLESATLRTKETLLVALPLLSTTLILLHAGDKDFRSSDIVSGCFLDNLLHFAGSTATNNSHQLARSLLATLTEFSAIPELAASIRLSSALTPALVAIATAANRVATQPSESAWSVTKKPSESAWPVSKQPNEFAWPVAKQPTESAWPVAKQPSESTWTVASALVCSLLQSQGATFVETSISFVASSLELIELSLNPRSIANNGFPESLLKLSVSTTRLFQGLSTHWRDWRFATPQLYSDVMRMVSGCCQVTLGFLIRHNYMIHIIENSGTAGVVASGTSVSTAGGSDSDRTYHSISVRVDTSPSDCSVRFNSTVSDLQEVVGNCIAGLVSQTPPLDQLIYNRALDLGAYGMLLSLDFSSPSVDLQTADPVVPLSFGGVLAAAALRPSPMATRTPTGGCPDTVALQRCLVLLLSQTVAVLRSPRFPDKDKDLLRRELGSELGALLEATQRRRSTTSPGTPRRLARYVTPGSPDDQRFLSLIGQFIRCVLK